MNVNIIFKPIILYSSPNEKMQKQKTARPAGKNHCIELRAAFMRVKLCSRRESLLTLCVNIDTIF
jgi:hypothetical protein